ncbi:MULTISPECIES: 3-hydroxyacyl-CoA dehydrogenase NAD-binding domain-containing protein [unclassified Brevibacterium]|uniref:3-hydroxyacyl-CoA dehydrogenase NAD-binding domain-containing protein n=1 Tax=unclassified Brevibacterium TaxID=2614124 RepID=UPI001E29D16B|nr:MULTISPECIES: 3-hydroxyacyl-CoA dehydrogenase NAD-binding domain-containing protein [unclassified Brevibacterium]MCD1285465.1 hydroxylacyl-CoA dehydrogenase [Brevibacterium sp. CCUG 69071]MDK8434514.1 3-hydroxyacyl-CoA dehydrogenase NAD-binding domain-containing protein [Brevibacterium sp. H-BE7]
MSSSVAVIGAGTIGRSFAFLFARSGHSVRVFDPRDDLAEVVTALQAEVSADAAAQDMVAAEIGSIEIAETVEAAVAEAVFVQESGPEDPESKPALFARIAAAAPAEAVLATSSSTIPASLIAERLPAAAAARVLVGHPFNPPHLMPLVEVVPSPTTSSETVDRALEFYRSCGREPVVLRREVRGFVGNRLQNALMKEAISLVQNGVVTAADLDAVMKNSLGLRWSAIGQFEGMHLGGGEAGIRGFMDHIGPSFAAIEDLPVDVDPSAMGEVFAQVEQAYGPHPTPAAAAERDRVQRAVLEARRQSDARSQGSAG